MNEPPQNAGETEAGFAFVSYATADRKQALSICDALEKRGIACWISCRDVKPGENYQEAIVRALRASRAVVLVFSGAANNSNEIKKELSLASRYEKAVLALRMENVEPSDAFAYELSTRQWIDAFAGRDRAIALLAEQLGDLSSSAGKNGATAERPRSHRLPRTGIGAAIIVMLLVLTAGWWLWLRPGPMTHNMTVRLDSFRALSADLPPAMADTIREEIIAAFGDDGAIKVSTASTRDKGSGPAYLLGGTVRRDGNKVRVITRLTNERSGTTLWTDSFDYDAAHVARVPRRIAVDAGNMVHCGLFAASTYHKPLPDPVMSDYMQFCQNSWWSQQFANPEKALDAARKVAAAQPDFSFGWSAITVAAQQVFFDTPPGPRREELRRMGIDAADKALRLDPKNSEAMAQKSLLIGRTDWTRQEDLLKRAIAARPLFCGCEHYLYGTMLKNVGRYTDSLREMRRSTEMLALDAISQFALGDALVATGKTDEAKAPFAASADLFRFPDTPQFIAIGYAAETGDYLAGLKAVEDPRTNVPPARRLAIRLGFEAMINGDRGAKQRAAQLLLSLPDEQINSAALRLIGALGSTHEVLEIIGRRALSEDFAAASLLWAPSMRAARSDPAFPGVVEKLGLIKYWRASGTRPDVCRETRSPPFCKAI